MAELVGLIASIGGIVGIAGTAAKFSSMLYRTARGAGSARDEIEGFAVVVNGFASTIRVAHESIRGYCRNNSQSQVLRYVDEYDALRDNEAQCERIADHIQAVKPRMRSIRSKLRWKTRIKWLLRRREVEALYPKMECVKSSLNLLILMVHLEVKGTEQQTPEIQREMKQLKKQVRLQARTIELLIRSIENLKKDWVHGFLQKPSSTDREEQSLLVHLAESMVERGHVPEGTFGSASSLGVSESTINDPISRQSSRTSSSTMSRIQRTNDKGKGPEGPTLHPTAHRQRSESNSPERNSHAVKRIRRQVNQLHAEQGLLEPSQGRRQTGNRDTGESSFSAGSGGSLVIPSEDQKLNQLPITSSQTAERDDYFAVRPAERVLYMNANRHIQDEHGFITPPNAESKIPLTACLDRELAENVISSAFAIEHDLEIEEDEEGNGVCVVFEPGVRTESIGQVVLEWSNKLFCHQPLRIRCRVVKYRGRPVIFGKPFIEKRNLLGLYYGIG